MGSPSHRTAFLFDSQQPTRCLTVVSSPLSVVRGRAAGRGCAWWVRAPGDSEGGEGGGRGVGFLPSPALLVREVGVAHLLLGMLWGCNEGVTAGCLGFPTVIVSGMPGTEQKAV